MQLYLDSFGAWLSSRNGMFRVRLSSGAEQSFALRQVDAILLTRGTGLSTDAALLAAENDIPVLLIDAQTHFPLAQIQSGRPGSIASIRKNQATFCRSAAGMNWVAEQLAAKVEAQRTHLFDLAEKTGAEAAFAASIRLTDKVLRSISKEFQQFFQEEKDWSETRQHSVAERFRGQEGTASRLYFQQLAAYFSGRLAFERRGRPPALDPFNCVLNYLYGMLYTAVHLAAVKSGLDPFMGVLHADQHQRPTLVFDAIEPFRPWADRVAVALADRTGFPDAFFEPAPAESGHPEAIWLRGEGKDEAIEAMLRFLGESTVFLGKKVRREVQIDLALQRLAVRLKMMEDAFSDTMP